MTKFYEPNKTFIEIFNALGGDAQKSYDEFEEAWDNSKDTRNLQEAMGVSDKEIVALSLGEITLSALLAKYKTKTAASV